MENILMLISTRVVVTVRQLDLLTMQQIQEIDTKRMRKSNAQLLPPFANILSVKLRGSLAHIL